MKGVNNIKEFIEMVRRSCEKMGVSESLITIEELEAMVLELEHEHKEINQNNINAWLVRNI